MYYKSIFFLLFFGLNTYEIRAATGGPARVLGLSAAAGCGAIAAVLARVVHEKQQQEKDPRFLQTLSSQELLCRYRSLSNEERKALQDLAPVDHCRRFPLACELVMRGHSLAVKHVYPLAKGYNPTHFFMGGGFSSYNDGHLVHLIKELCDSIDETGFTNYKGIRISAADALLIQTAFAVRGWYRHVESSGLEEERA